MNKELFASVARKATLAAAFTPVVLGAVGCAPDPDVESGSYVSFPGKRINGEYTKDRNAYPFQIVVQTASMDPAEHAVELYAQKKPVLTEDNKSIRIDGLVFCPDDEDGKKIGCSKLHDRFFDGFSLQIDKGSVLIQEEYLDQPRPSSQSTSSRDYKYEIILSGSVDPQTGNSIEFYTNEPPKNLSSGALSAFEVNDVFCPKDDQQDQVGCNGENRYFKTMTVIGGFGTTSIRENPSYRP